MESGMIGIKEEKCAICGKHFIPHKEEKCRVVCQSCLEEMRKYCPKCEAFAAMRIWPSECAEHVHYGIKLDRVLAQDPRWHHPLKRQIIFKQGKGLNVRSINFGSASNEVIEKVREFVKERHAVVASLCPDFDPDFFLMSCETCGALEFDYLHLVHDDGTEALMLVCRPCLRDAKTGGSA